MRALDESFIFNPRKEWRKMLFFLLQIICADRKCENRLAPPTGLIHCIYNRKALNVKIPRKTLHC